MTPPLSYGRLVGAELVHLRKATGLSRADVAEAVSLADPETLGRYENGSGDLTVVTFAEMCRTLGTLPNTVLARVDALEDKIVVDLRMVVASGHPDLSVLRGWAVRCLTSSGDPLIVVPIRVIGALARVHGVDPVTVVSALGDCVPGSLRAP